MPGSANANKSVESAASKVRDIDSLTRAVTHVDDARFAKHDRTRGRRRRRGDELVTGQSLPPPRLTHLSVIPTIVAVSLQRRLATPRMTQARR
jgi:hypothetical protein